jgi:hypothetical protein
VTASPRSLPVLTCSTTERAEGNITFDLRAQQVRERRTVPAIRHMNQVDAGHHFEQFAGEVTSAAIAGRRHIDLPGMCLRVGNKVGKRLGLPLGPISETAVNAALAFIESAKPQEELECVLVIQMACTPTAGMAVLARLGGSRRRPKRRHDGNCGRSINPRLRNSGRGPAAAKERRVAVRARWGDPLIVRRSRPK